MKIVVTGSLGNISKPLTENLIRRSHAVTVISSKANKQAEIEALGATAAIGSLEDTDFLTDTFTGADAVYVMVPPNLSVPDPRAYYTTIGNSYAKAMEQSGIKKVVQLSSMGADLDTGTGLILGSHDVERILARLSGVTVTTLRPGYFYVNLLGFIDMIRHMGYIGTNYGGDIKIAMVHPEDIADAATEELTTDTGTKVRYVVSGDYTGNETAQVLGAAIGKPDLQWPAATDKQMQQGLEGAGLPTNIAALFVEMGNSIKTSIIRQDYDRRTPAAMGKIKLEEFAEEFAAAYNG